MSETVGSLDRPSKAMTAREGASNVEESIPLQEMPQRRDNVSQGQAEDENMSNGEHPTQPDTTEIDSLLDGDER